jgi:hypothetical protein
MHNSSRKLKVLFIIVKISHQTNVLKSKPGVELTRPLDHGSTALTRPNHEKTVIEAPK